MLNSIHPISEASEDHLDRASFSQYLARCIIHHGAFSSLVVGLNGGWGTGKTSVANMVTEEILRASDNGESEDRCIVLNFNPWNYSGSGKMIYHFFRRFNSVIAQCDFIEKKKKTALLKLVHVYSLFFQDVESIDSQMFFRSHNASLGEFALDKAQETLDIIQVKSRVNDILQTMQHKIVVILDNIGRLRPTEIREIFQLVNCLANFSQTAFLMSYDRDHILDCLDTVQSGDNQAFLHKMVHVNFDMPSISHKDVMGVLIRGLEGLLDTVPEQDLWNKTYWSEAYYLGLRFLFHSIRDVSAYLWHLDVIFERLKLLINPIDCFSMVAIQYSLPELCQDIRNNQDLFTNLLSDIYEENEETLHLLRARADAILSRVSVVKSDKLLPFLCHLFPRLNYIYHKNVSHLCSDSEARRYRRICCAEVFDVFFRLSLPVIDLRQDESEMMMTLTNDQTLFEQMLLRLNKNQRAGEVVDYLLSGAVSEIPLEDMQNVCVSLVNIADLLPEEDKSLLAFSPMFKVYLLIKKMFSRISSAEEHFRILQVAFSRSELSLYIQVYLLKRFSKRVHEEDEEISSLSQEVEALNTIHLLKLRSLVIKNIEKWADKGILFSYPHMKKILQAWFSWGEMASIRPRIQTMIADDGLLVNCITMFFHDELCGLLRGGVSRSSWSIDVAGLPDFMQDVAVQERVEAIFQNIHFKAYREQQQMAVMIFLDTLGSTVERESLI
jgi:predicted KAP-like P-loop ATPase